MEGNRMKMRETLEKLVEIIDKCDGSSPLWWHCGEKGVMPLKNAKAALALPPRNCDVGTAEEQAQRYDQFCEENECSMCPVHAKWRQHFDVCKHEHISCGLIWAQMPYEAEEGGAK